MSGGSYQYAYRHIVELAGDIRRTTPLRKALAAHLEKVAEACRMIEWVDSCDCGPGDEDEAIRKCLGKSADALVLAEVLADAKKIQEQLTEAISSANETHHQRPEAAGCREFGA